MFKRLGSWLAGAGIPDSRGLVSRSRDYALPIRTELREENCEIMSERLSHGLPSSGIPDPRGLVSRSRDHPLSIRAEPGGIDLIIMSERLNQRLARADIPDPRRVRGNGEYALAIRTKLDGADT